MHDSNNSSKFSGTSIAGMSVVGIVIALIWLDEYNVEIHPHNQLLFPPPHVVLLSWILLGLAFLWGAITEILYARSLRQYVHRG